MFNSSVSQVISISVNEVIKIWDIKDQVPPCMHYNAT